MASGQGSPCFQSNAPSLVVHHAKFVIFQRHFNIKHFLVHIGKVIFPSSSTIQDGGDSCEPALMDSYAKNFLFTIFKIHFVMIFS